MLYILCNSDLEAFKFEVTYDTALAHIKAGGTVFDYNGNTITTKKELKNAEGIGSEPGVECDSGLSGDGEVSKASNSKLFGTLGDNSE